MTVFTTKAVKDAKGNVYAPGKADITEVGYNDRNDYAIYKLCSNYSGRLKGGFAKTWRLVKRDLTLAEAKAFLAKKVPTAGTP